MEPTTRIDLPDGRILALDDVGDPAGRPVVYLHGTPDSRLARHPDDGLAAAAGVRLLAVDRPGAGASTPHPAATLTSLGEDLAALLDHLDLPSVALLGWSNGGLQALGAASALGARVDRVVLVGTVPPVEAYADPDLVAALGPGRQHFVELVRGMPPEELAAEMVHLLVPLPLTPEVALEHVLEMAGPVGRAELDAVPGAAARLAAALEGAVAQGLDGLRADLRLQVTPGLDLTTVAAPVTSVHGTDDGVSPPIVGEWLAARLPAASVVVHQGAGHHLLLPRWREVLELTG